MRDVICRRHWPRVEIAVRSARPRSSPWRIRATATSRASRAERDRPAVVDPALRQSGKDKVAFLPDRAKSWSGAGCPRRGHRGWSSPTAGPRQIVTYAPVARRSRSTSLHADRYRVPAAIPDRLLAAASVAPDRAPPLAVAHRDVRDATTGIPQDRRRIEELNTRIKIALPSAYHRNDRDGRLHRRPRLIKRRVPPDEPERNLQPVTTRESRTGRTARLAQIGRQACGLGICGSFFRLE